MALGHDEASFWAQTFASYGAVMRAHREQAQVKAEERIALDHIQAQMIGHAMGGSIPPAEDFIAQIRPKPKKQTPLQMLANLQNAAGSRVRVSVTKRDS